MRWTYVNWTDKVPCQPRSAVDTLKGDEKFFCNACGTYQEAQKRTRLSALPDVLLLHLNRFKYTTHMDRCGLCLLTT
jgi:ubiquitin C-terminal hydrolase